MANRNSDAKNYILKGLASMPVVRPELNDFTAALLKEMDKDRTIEIIWAKSCPTTSLKDSIITYSITNWGREFLGKGGY